MKFLITGCGGSLAQEFLRQLGKDAIGFTKNQLDIISHKQCKKVLQKLKPKYIINCAAYTKVDEAEKRQDLAYYVNAFGVENLALIAKDLNIPVIHFSTDYIFDGERYIPYHEDFPPNPLSFYGTSKLLGEKYLRKCWDKHYIIRTSWLYGGKNDFVSWVKNSLESPKAICDHFGSPTYIPDLVEGTLKLIGHPFGTYNITGDGYTNWYGIANVIRQDLIEVKTKDLNRPAKRPLYSVLGTTKYQQTTGHKLPFWKDSLNKYLSS